jgi:hypothetical protein
MERRAEHVPYVLSDTIIPGFLDLQSGERLNDLPGFPKSQRK